MASKIFDIVKMNFIRPLHLGQESDAVEAVEQMCHSDTLFSAICHSWLKLFGKSDLENMLKAFQQAGDDNTEPPFCLSSAFPFITIADEPIYYLPKPQMQSLNVDPEHPRSDEIGKKLKSLKEANWITKKFFEDWIAADKRSLKVEDIPEELEAHYDNVEAVSKQIDGHIGTAIRPRVALDSVSGESRLFFFGMLRFARGSGLYSMVKWREADRANWEGKLKGAVRLLGDTGLGGERTSGYGVFKSEWSKLNLSLPDEPTNGMVTLSLYYPSKSDLTKGVKLWQYMLMPRAGWASSPALRRAYRRKVVTMFTEGSTAKRGITKTLRRKVTGCLIDVTPDGLISNGGHHIYKYGFAFTLPTILPS